MPNNGQPSTGKVYDFTTNWFNPALPQWPRLIDEFVGKAENGLEIGCFEGRSSVWIIENVCTHPNSKLTTIDTFEGNPEFVNGVEKVAIDVNGMESRFRSNIAATGKQEQVEIIKNNSLDCLIAWNNDKNNLNLQFDFAYIDGSHEADSVLLDASLVWRLMKYNGIVIFDDYALRRYAEPYNNPYVGIDAFLATHELEIEILESNYQLAIRKIKRDRSFSIIDWSS